MKNSFSSSCCAAVAVVVADVVVVVIVSVVATAFHLPPLWQICQSRRAFFWLWALDLTVALTLPLVLLLGLVAVGPHMRLCLCFCPVFAFWRRCFVYIIENQKIARFFLTFSRPFSTFSCCVHVEPCLRLSLASAGATY